MIVAENEALSKKGPTLIKKSGRDCRIQLTKQLNYHINIDEDFKGRHKNGRERAFTRNRPLPFNYLTVAIMKMGKSGLQREIDSFFGKTEDEDFNIRWLTKSAFTQARKYLSPEAFLELDDVIVQNFYENVGYLGYKNHRLLAIDRGFLSLPDHASVREEFGRRAFGRGTKKDVPNRFCKTKLGSSAAESVHVMPLDL